jgi:hypothetical protein
MTVTWERTDDGLEIRQSGNFWARAFGLPFLAAGLFLLWHFVLGLAGFLIPSLGQLTIAGVIALPIFTLLVGVPGWLLVLTRKLTAVDVAHRRIAEVWDHRIFRHRKERPVPSRAAVRLRLEQSQSTGGRDDRTVVLLLVEVSAPAAPPIPLAVLGDTDVETARALALEVAGVLGLAIADELAKGPVDPSDEDDDEEPEEPVASA